ncbi:minor tail protein [Mycobacterium phage RedRaider77]|uniref:Minor tail protein n=1 Tax=Mycobacterium phage RedRaider77 TaxID=2500794 RepID=A0A411AYG7_9CAUD|nr:minor tail protein [Mycobacterium phage RedRaider77]
MTLPNGPAGLATVGLEFAFTNDGSIPGAINRTRDNIEAVLKGDIFASEGWQGAHLIAFDGLPAGIPLFLGHTMKMAEQITGIPLSTWGDPALGLINEVFDAIGTFSARLTSMFPSIDFTKIGSWNPVEEIIDWIVNDLLPLGLFPGLDDLLGVLPEFIGAISIPLGAITAERPNLLTDPTFPDGAIAENEMGWVVDLGSSRTVGGTGAAHIEADGNYHALRTGETPNDRILVRAGQTFTAEIWVSYENLVASGQCIQLHVMPFKGDERQSSVMLDYHVPNSENLGWPGVQLVGDYRVPEGVTSVQKRLVLTDDALSGDVWWDDAEFGPSGKLFLDWIEGLPEALADELGRWHLLKDSIYNAITGAQSIFTEMEDFIEAFTHLPPTLIVGWGGPGNMEETLKALTNAIVGGVVGLPDAVGAGISDVASLLNLVSQLASRGGMAWDVLGIRNNTRITTGFLKTGHSNRDLAAIRKASAATYFAATQTNTAVVSERIEVSAPIGVISWLGYGTSGITEFYINVWLVEGDNRKLLHHSPNLVSILDVAATSSEPGYMFYEIDPAGKIPSEAGQEILYEFIPVGGTHYMVCDVEGSWVKPHPLATLDAFAYTRSESSPNAPAITLAKTAFTASTSVPWVEAAIEVGDYSGSYDPIQLYVAESGSRPIPGWVNFVDVVIAPAGGGGRAGATGGFFGEGGKAGPFFKMTLERGVHYSGSSTILSWTLGDGGNGGTLFDPMGKKGEDSEVWLPGYSFTVEGCNGGTILRNIITGDRPSGQSPGYTEYKGLKCPGGKTQEAYGGNGQFPGGGGNGGNWLLLQSGGKGAPAAMWLQMRQDALEDETVGDTTPPTAPTVALVGKSFSTITVTAVGGSDNSGVIGSHNYFIAPEGEDPVRVNMDPIPHGENCVFDGLDSNTDYDIWATNLDLSGNESPMSDPTTVRTSAYEWEDEPMDPALTAQIDAFVSSMMSDGAGPGISVYITGPQGYYAKAYGSAGSRPLTLDDHFRLGSATKTFTAMAVLQCIDEGLFDFETTLASFDHPQYDLSKIPYASSIKIKHLMTMRSGVYDYQTNFLVLMMFYLNPTFNFSPAGAYQLMRDNNGIGPGKQFQYNNGNHVLLGFCVEAVTGRSIREYVKTEFIDALGLTETYWPAFGDFGIRAPYTNGYGGPQGTGQNITKFNHELFGAAGAIISTISDLHRWTESLRDNYWLSPELWDIWTTVSCPLPNNAGYGGPTYQGYGLANYIFGRWRSHPGSQPGFEVSSFFNIDNGAVISIMENSQSATGGIGVAVMLRLFPQIANLLYPGSMETPEFTPCTLTSDPEIEWSV